MRVTLVAYLFVLAASLASGYVFTDEDKRDCDKAANHIKELFKGTKYFMQSCRVQVINRDSTEKNQWILAMAIDGTERGPYICPEVLVTSTSYGGFIPHIDVDTCRKRLGDETLQGF